MPKAKGEQRKRGRTRFVAVSLVVVLFYPLSFGPAFWVTSHFTNPTPAFETLARFYQPLIVLLLESPDVIRQPVIAYLNLGADKTKPIFIIDATASKGMVFLMSYHGSKPYRWASHVRFNNR